MPKESPSSSGNWGNQPRSDQWTTLRTPGSYEAFVLGSGIYAGSWLREATKWVNRHQVVLAQHPVWLFSSGPLGEVKDLDSFRPKEMAKFQQAIRPREERIFFGALDYHKLSFPDRVILKALRAHEGDFRDWPAIESWAASIARDLG